ncbi:MAG TPA: lamin tail domain-containing protein [Verrucomicrobiae bacterium]|nr:lamin tail domain-containing protein [Verrucomicrobiae bacterium]
MIKKVLASACLGVALGASAQVSTNINYLRTLVDGNYLPSDTNTFYVVTGIVTTHANLTPAPNSLFYLQDNTAGIAVFAGSPTGLLPQAGDSLTVTGRLDHFSGLLEFRFDVTGKTNSSGNALPVPTPLNFNLTAAQYEALEGSYVVVSNVFIDQSSPTFSSTTITITNQASETFALFVNANTDIVGKARPVGPCTIYGVLGQFDNTSPYDSGYQLIPTRIADLVTPNLPPTIQFTNVLSNLVRPGDSPTNSTFKEYALRTGETLTINARIFDADGSNVTIFPAATTPTGGWTAGSTSGTDLTASFTYTAQAGDAGNAYQAVMEARTSRGTNVTTWKIYVPTAEEQNVIISEFLAGPTTDTNSPYWNPLHRSPPGSTNAFADDEYIEIVNLNDAPMEFLGWSFSDSASFRHQFYDFFSVGASNTLVLYGGRKNNEPAPPSIPGSSAPFSDVNAGTSVLNNGADTINLYNLDSNLVVRVVYDASAVPNGVALTRYPTLSNDFVVHTSVVITNASPGLQPDQRGYDQPVIIADPPTISAIADQSIDQGSAAGPLAFTVGDPVTPVNNLTLSGFSSNPTLVPHANITFGGSGANRTVTVTPVSSQIGTATITVSVGNASLRSASTSFVLTVNGTNAPTALFCDDFSYANGSIITNSGFVWTNHSGTIGQMQVDGGKLQVTGSQSEDVNRLLPGQPLPVGFGMLYYSFTANFSALPTATGGYFAHFKNATTTFRSQLWSMSSAGGFRIGIANTSSAANVIQFPQDLDLNVTYRIVVRHNMSTGESTLWIDPANEASTSVVTTDGTAATSLVAFAFRQAAGIGTMAVDDLCIGTSFSSVVPSTPPSIPLSITQSGNNVVLSWSNPAYSLYSGTNVTQITNKINGATSPYTNTINGPAQFFRLIWP